MKTVTFLLHTQQPILATSLQGDPNSDVSHAYIPGSMIRGMLIGRYQKLYRPLETNILENDDVKRLFFNSTTRYLNAYLFDSDRQKRTLPVPLCLYKDKVADVTDEASVYIYDFSQVEAINRPKNFSPKCLEESFCIVDRNSLSLYSEKRRINIHNQRNRQRGRGIEGSGAVFRYDAIDAGQTFKAVVLCDRDEDAQIIQSLLQADNSEFLDVWLGGSQSAGYGHIKVQLFTDECDGDDWNELKMSYEERSDRYKHLTVTLLSDTILRDEWGQPTTNPQPLVKLLSDALDVELKHINTYAKSQVVGGFNRKWGLPLPQTPALAAGSVFVFEIPHTQLKSLQVRNLEVQGIGERRVEGFGRIALNWLPENDSFFAQKVNLNVKYIAYFSTSSSNLKEVPRIQMLLAMLQCDNPPSAEDTRYMTIDNKEYVDRPVLPTPFQVMAMPDNRRHQSKNADTVKPSHQNEIIKTQKSQKFKVDEILDAKVIKINGIEITYEFLEGVKRTTKEHRKAKFLKEGQVVQVQIIALKDNGEIKSVKLC